MRTLGLLALLIFCNAAPAGECRTRSTTVRLESGFTVVPFAVPVAVPVATIQQPTVFYGYSAVPSTPVTPNTATVQSPTAREPSHTIFAQHCAACHTGQTAQGKLAIFDDQGRLFDQLPRQAIMEMVSPDSTGHPRMPPDPRPKLTPEELQVLQAWAKPPKTLVY